MLVHLAAMFSARHRARAGILLLMLFAGACRDAVLDLAVEHDPSSESAGAAGAPDRTGEAGAAGEASVRAGAGNEPVGMTPDAAGLCGDAIGDCLYRRGNLECSGDVGETRIEAQAGDRARLLLDVSSATELRVTFEICDARGYVLNIGDSPSNNGGGGDAGDFQHDAEILIYSTDLTASSSDLGYEQLEPGIGYHPFLLQRAGYVSSAGCSLRTLHVRDQYIADGDDPTLRTQTPTALRIDPSEDDQGTPDAYWYLGVNRVVSSSLDDRFRVGTGLVAIRLCFAMAPPEPPSRAGP